MNTTPFGVLLLRAPSNRLLHLRRGRRPGLARNARRAQAWSLRAHRAEGVDLLRALRELVHGAPGFTGRPLRQMSGDCEFSEIYLDGVEVPEGNVLGREHGGWEVAITTLMLDRKSTRLNSSHIQKSRMPSSA